MTPADALALRTKFDAIKKSAADLETQVTALEPLIVKAVEQPTAPPPVGGSGEAMPTGDLPGWKMSWKEDFLTDCPEGQFGATYPNLDVHYYGTDPVDTSHRGFYDRNNMSVSNSIQRLRIYTDAQGVHHVGVWSPRLSGVGKWGDVASGRFAIRFRSDSIPTYKQAWLLWPMSGQWPRDGEIDYPERSLDSTSIHAFMHRQWATVGSDQDSASKVVDCTKWHTAVTEWVMGQSCAFYLDGVLLKKITERVPSTPMHWNIQTETILNKTIPINNAAKGYVEIDWLCYWAKV